MCECIVGPYRDPGQLRRAGSCRGYEGILFYQHFSSVANSGLRIFSGDTHRHMKVSSRLYARI